MMEFDWFATDVTGAIGLFSTGGWGDIAVEVVRHSQQHQQIAGQFLPPNFGSLAIWDDFARYGLYVFDWKPYEGPYIQVAQPLVEPNNGIKQAILNLPELLLLPVSFLTLDRIVLADFKLFR